MATNRQKLGDLGERHVAKRCNCPRCKRKGALKKLPTNFKCVDIICDFCGYLAQVKTATVRDIEKLPDQVLGGAWAPQKDRMDAGIYFPLFLVLVSPSGRKRAVYYLPVDLQKPEMFVPRKPLSKSAKRAGWQGFTYDLRSVSDSFVLLP